ncbi:uncharacterized protein LOC143136510 [Alosa pseudoharengus]|uniref:uncharacterized protein LOC143136510 n=1 Tax=Alosa pseudoharengus TaxID=34774 RepID=UPI003F8CEDFB
MKFRNHTVALSIQNNYIYSWLRSVATTLDQRPVFPPYEQHGIRFETTTHMVTVYIDKVDTKVSFDINNNIIITLGENFRKNSIGQCGECGGSSCVRPDGQIEDDTCCPQTAYDWISPDPSKPQCASAPRNQSCSPPPPSTPPPTQSPPTPCPTPICDLLTKPVFQECKEQLVNLSWVEQSCRFDECHGMPCPSLALAAYMCKQSLGVCVEWRHLTNGNCNVSCPDGMEYKECRNKLDDHCNGRTLLSNGTEGIFIQYITDNVHLISGPTTPTTTTYPTTPSTTYTTTPTTTYITTPPTTTAPTTTYTTTPTTTYITTPTTAYTTTPTTTTPPTTTYTTTPPTTTPHIAIDTTTPPTTTPHIAIDTTTPPTTTPPTTTYTTTPPTTTPHIAIDTTTPPTTTPPTTTYTTTPPTTTPHIAIDTTAPPTTTPPTTTYTTTPPTTTPHIAIDTTTPPTTTPPTTTYTTTPPTTTPHIAIDTTTPPTTTPHIAIDTTTPPTTTPPTTTYTTTPPTTTPPTTTYTTTPPTTTPHIALDTTIPPTTTPPTTTYTTTPPTTTPHIAIDTTTPPTTTCKPCRDPQRGLILPCRTTWTEDCFDKTCDNGRIIWTPVTCPYSPVPNCPRGVCTVSGDPHYTTFQNTYYDFQGNCTYTLVQELLPRQQLSIVVDNFFCFRPSTVTCAKGIVMKFRNHTISLAQKTISSKPIVILNKKLVSPPHWEDGLRFETSGNKVSVYMEKIRSHVSMAPSARVTIALAMEHFHNNVEGQCGECGGSSCVRPGGVREDNNCCPQTAFDWIYPNPIKNGFCDEAPRNKSCVPTPTPSPCPPIFKGSLVCEIIGDSVFDTCREQGVDLESLERNCRFDVCVTDVPELACSMVAQAAEECLKVGVCVAWHHLTNGICSKW